MTDKNVLLSKLAGQCREVASCLSYNMERSEGEAKHTLIEAAGALDINSIRVHRKRDGLLILNANGKARYMTLRERLAFYLLRGKTEIRP